VEVIRCFIAVDVAEELRQVLAREYRLLARQVKGLRWVTPNNYHLTLKFLGEVAREQIPAIAQVVRRAAAAVAPFTVRLVGLGAFPQRSNPRVVWVSVSEGTAELRALWRQIDGGLAELGFAADQRRFTPHLTIARARSGLNSAELQPVFRRLQARDWGAYTVTTVNIMQSQLQPNGPIYTVLERIPLQGDC